MAHSRRSDDVPPGTSLSPPPLLLSPSSSATFFLSLFLLHGQRPQSGQREETKCPVALREVPVTACAGPNNSMERLTEPGPSQGTRACDLPSHPPSQVPAGHRPSSPGIPPREFQLWSGETAYCKRPWPWSLSAKGETAGCPSPSPLPPPQLLQQPPPTKERGWGRSPGISTTIGCPAFCVQGMEAA